MFPTKTILKRDRTALALNDWGTNWTQTQTGVPGPVSVSLFIQSAAVSSRDIKRSSMDAGVQRRIFHIFAMCLQMQTAG